MLLKAYLKARRVNSQFLFPGRDATTRRWVDRPTRTAVAWQYFKKIRKNLEMTQRYDQRHYYYRPSSFRVLYLDILKSSGFPADWAEYLVGHSIGFQASYLPSTTTLARAWLKHDSEFCFLRDNNQEPTEVRVAENPVADMKQEVIGSTPRVHGPRTTHWRTKNFDYLKTHIQSVGYDQAIAEGFSIFDSSDTGVRVFRKRFRRGKQWMKSVNRALVSKRADFKDHGKPL